MTTSTITTVVVFLPLGLLQGVVGQFFIALSVTLACAVIVSWFLALTVIPVAISFVLKSASHDDPLLIRAAQRVYAPALDWALLGASARWRVPSHALEWAVSGALAAAALLALMSLLIGMFSGARQATVNRQVTPTAVPTPIATPPAALLYAFGRGEADPLSSPTGLALNPLGNLYIADTGNDRIRRISAIDSVAARSARSMSAGLLLGARGPISGQRCPKSSIRGNREARRERVGSAIARC